MTSKPNQQEEELNFSQQKCNFCNSILPMRFLHPRIKSRSKWVLLEQKKTEKGK
uniref:Uncharacterized protein n=1 Tax=Rhizophora mucronata TaxID=61149 RepID=A0A2P2MVY6_RHIMU